MRRCKEQCEALVKAGAIILVRDGFTEGGIPVYVTRKVTGCFGVKCGRDSEWGVTVDRPFKDGADGVVYNLILGVNVGDKVEVKGLQCDAEIYTRHFSNEEREMILSDAMARLKMADKPVYRIEEYFRYLYRRDCPLVDTDSEHPVSSWISGKVHQTSDVPKTQGRQCHNSNCPIFQILVLCVLPVD